jgi:hypothetical protein
MHVYLCICIHICACVCVHLHLFFIYFVLVYLGYRENRTFVLVIISIGGGFVRPLLAIKIVHSQIH